jgi:[lysine-biosynthesis-protein LysW]--L-2-aminoadipate ligase
MRESPSRVAVVGWEAGRTNGPIVEAWQRLGIAAELLDPCRAEATLHAGDVAVVRLDVRRTLDGIESGLWHLPALEARGVRVINRAAALLAAHDKLRTARRLGEARIPHPATCHVTTLDELGRIPVPFVAKPRFGSWGWDVRRCRSASERGAVIGALAEREWFRRQGAIVQELLPALESDLRILVAGGRVVGACRRRAKAGEWRSNVSLGGSLVPIDAPPAAACDLAVGAVECLGGDFVGVDIAEGASGALLVLEVNGAPDFDGRYTLGRCDVFAEIAARLGLPRNGAHAPAARAVAGRAVEPRVADTRMKLRTRGAQCVGSRKRNP